MAISPRNSPSSPLFRSACILAAFVFITTVRPSETQEKKPAILEQRPSFHVGGSTPIRALAALGLEGRIPLGIVVEGKSPLCRGITPDMQYETVKAALDGTLLGTGYTWELTDDVVIVKPAHEDPRTDKTLDLKFNIRSHRDTMQMLGTVLNGYIAHSIHPDKGYAASMFSNPKSEMIPPFTLTDATIRQIANFIVKQEGKGAWVFKHAPSEQGKEEEFTMRILDYSDDGSYLPESICQN